MGKLNSTIKALDKALDMTRAARMKRAREMGFDTDRVLYHGGQSDIHAFSPDRGGSVYLTDDPAIAEIYADNAARRRPGMVNAAPNVTPVMVRGNTLSVSDLGPDGSNGWISDNISEALGFDANSVPVGRRANAINDEARRQGYGVIEMRDFTDLGGKQTQYKVLDPSNIRSVNAAFDPAKADSPNLLAGGAAAAVGLGAATGSEDSEAGVITRGGKKLLEFWHGSPHKFDRFDMSKIGTGEGAQAYGHGLYGADSRDVADWYRKNLADERAFTRAVNPEALDYGVAEMPPRTADEAGRMLDNFIEDSRFSIEEAIDGGDLDASMLPAFEDYANRLRADDGLRQTMLSGGSTYDDLNRIASEMAESGNLYRVEADIDPDMLLDWDKPLSEQSEGVQAAVKDLLTERTLDGMPDDEFYSVMQNIDPNGVWTPEDQLAEFDYVASKDEILADLKKNDPDIYTELQDYLSSDLNLDEPGRTLYQRATAQQGGGNVWSNPSQAEVSRRLRETGIPGIRYLDGMSRNAGEGSYNYVMFDDKPLRIVERGNINPILASAMAGVSAGTAAYLQESERRQSRWDALRGDLLNALATVDREFPKLSQPVFDALDMPWRGLLGATRTLGGLVAGDGFDASVAEGARQAQQPIDQTAYEIGGITTDVTGSPLAGTVVNTAVNFGGPG